MFLQTVEAANFCLKWGGDVMNAFLKQFADPWLHLEMEPIPRTLMIFVFKTDTHDRAPDKS